MPTSIVIYVLWTDSILAHLLWKNFKISTNFFWPNIGPDPLPFFVIKFVSDLKASRLFSPPIKLATMVQLKYC